MTASFLVRLGFVVDADQIAAANKELRKTTGVMGDLASALGTGVLFELGRRIVDLFARLPAELAKALTGGIRFNRLLETMQVQFRTLLRSADDARKRLSFLTRIAASTPFQLEELAQANRVLQVMTGGALATAAGMRLVGDAAAATASNYQGLAMWVGRAYDGLQNGRPVGEALLRLQELGILTASARSEIEAMQRAGVEGAQVWAVLEGELRRFEGGMESLSQTMSGRLSTLADSWNLLLGEATQGLFARTKQSLESLIALLEDPAFREWAFTLAKSIEGLVDMVGRFLGLLAPLRAGITAVFGLLLLVLLARSVAWVGKLITAKLALLVANQRLAGSYAALNMQMRRVQGSAVLLSSAPIFRGLLVRHFARGILTAAGAVGKLTSALRVVRLLFLGLVRVLGGWVGLLITAVSLFGIFGSRAAGARQALKGLEEQTRSLARTTAEELRNITDAASQERQITAWKEQLADLVAHQADAEGAVSDEYARQIELLRAQIALAEGLTQADFDRHRSEQAAAAQRERATRDFYDTVRRLNDQVTTEALAGKPLVAQLAAAREAAAAAAEQLGGDPGAVPQQVEAYRQQRRELEQANEALAARRQLIREQLDTLPANPLNSLDTPAPVGGDGPPRGMGEAAAAMRAWADSQEAAAAARRQFLEAQDATLTSQMEANQGAIEDVSVSLGDLAGTYETYQTATKNAASLEKQLAQERSRRLQEETRLSREELAAQAEAVELDYQQGLLSLDQYYDARRAIIRQETQAELDAIGDKVPTNAAEQAAQVQAVEIALMEEANRLRALGIEQERERAAALTRSYEAVREATQGAIADLDAQINQLAAVNSPEAITRLTGLEERRAELIKEAREAYAAYLRLLAQNGLAVPDHLRTGPGVAEREGQPTKAEQSQRRYDTLTNPGARNRGASHFETAGEGITAAFQDYATRVGTLGDMMHRAMTTVTQSIEGGLFSAFEGLLSKTMTFGEALQTIAGSFVKGMIQGFAQLAAEYVMLQLKMLATDKAVAAKKMAMSAVNAAKSLAEWMPSAIAASISSFGVAAAIGLAAVVALLGSRRSGGYAGNQREDEVAGVYHGREYILNAADTRMLGGPGGVERMLAAARQGVDVTRQTHAGLGAAARDLDALGVHRIPVGNLMDTARRSVPLPSLLDRVQVPLPDPARLFSAGAARMQAAQAADEHAASGRGAGRRGGLTSAEIADAIRGGLANLTIVAVGSRSEADDIRAQSSGYVQTVDFGEHLDRELRARGLAT